MLVWAGSIVIGIILLVVFGDRLSDKIVEVAEKAGFPPNYKPCSHKPRNDAAGDNNQCDGKHH